VLKLLWTSVQSAFLFFTLLPFMNSRNILVGLYWIDPVMTFSLNVYTQKVKMCRV